MLIKLNNYNDHPEDASYIVFQFYQIEMATMFEGLLLLSNIPFEKDPDTDERNAARFLFGVKKVYEKEAMLHNNKVMASYKQKFIPQKGMRYALLLFTLATILFALVGYLKS